MSTIMNVKKLKGLIAQVQDCKEKIASERDKLRELNSDIEEITSDCDNAVADLESATDALSRLL